AGEDLRDGLPDLPGPRHGRHREVGHPPGTDELDGEAARRRIPFLAQDPALERRTIAAAHEGRGPDLRLDALRELRVESAELGFREADLGHRSLRAGLAWPRFHSGNMQEAFPAAEERSAQASSL